MQRRGLRFAFDGGTVNEAPKPRPFACTKLLKNLPFFLPGRAVGAESAMSAKTDVLDLVQGLPDDVTLEDIQYQLYVREKIEKSLSCVSAGKIKSNEEAAAIIASWRK